MSADQTFITAEGVAGHLEYTGRSLGAHGRYHAFQLEVREVREGFQVHDVRFKNKSGRWMEDRRNIMAVYQSKAEAIAAVKESDRGWFECVAEDLEEQRERQRIETRLELSLAPCYDRAHLVDDWLRSAWCGSSRAVLPTAERAQQEPEISR